MEKRTTVFFLFCVMLLSTYTLQAQRWDHTDDDRKVAIEVDTIQKKGYTLIWINKDKNFNASLKNDLITTFFTNYPKLVKTFNKKSRKEVTFVIDPEYKGVAATAGGIVRFSPEWFAKNPKDIDVVTHEVMHIVQAYPNDSGPWWITEGIADFIRFKYGVANLEGNWKLPEFTTTQKYTDSYRITARFFHWIESNVKKNFVKKLDKAMREKTFTEDFWKDVTGSSIDSLWSDYANNPSI